MRKNMEIEIKLTKDECNYLLNIVDYYQSKYLTKSWRAVKNLKYKTAKGFYKSKKSFENDMKYKKKCIKQQVIDVERIYEKISEKMEEKCYE